MTVVTSGTEPIGADGNDWVDVLDVSGGLVVNSITLINEGDWPGFWRLVFADGSTTPPARLPAGGGEVGERRAGVSIPCRGFSGSKLQVMKAGPLSGNLERLWAFGLE